MEFINSKILKNLGAYFVSSIITAGISILLNPFMASKLSHYDYAIIGYFASFTILLTPLVTFSLQSYYARNYFKVSEVERKKIYSVILTIYSTFSGCVFALFYIIYLIYHSLAGDAFPSCPYALLTFLPIWLSSFYNLYIMDLKMKGDGVKYAVVTISYAVLSAILSIVLVCILEYGSIGRLVAVLSSTIIVTIYCLLAKRIQLTWDVKIIRDALRFTWPLIISGILSYFFLGIDRVFLESLNDTISLGLYNIGLQISGYIAIVGTVLMQTFDPDIYKFTSRGEHRKVIFLCCSIIGIVFLVNLLFILCSKYIIFLLTAGRYVESTPYANILCFKNVTTTFAYLMSGVLIGYGFSKLELLNRLFGSIISVILYYFLITNFGYIGAAWGQSLSWLCMGCISLICLFIILKYKKNDSNYSSSGL